MRSNFPVDVYALTQLVLRIDKASTDHRITPTEAATIARQSKRVVMQSGDKAAASQAVLDQYQRLQSLRVDPLKGQAKDTLQDAVRDLVIATKR